MLRIRSIVVGLLAWCVVCPVLPCGSVESGFRAALGPDAALAQRSRRRGKRREPRYEGVSVENGGAIEGVITWKDKIPQIVTKKVPAPPEQQPHCGGAQIPLELLLVDEETKGIRYTVVYIDGITKGKPLPKPDIDLSTGKKAKLDQIECQYVPRVMVVPRGSTLAITSSDDVLHNVNARMGLDMLFNLAFNKAGVVIDDPKKTNVGRKTGVLVVRCDAGHYWMGGYVHVVAHPYYAVTDKQGKYKLTDVPPGEHTVKIWHENFSPRFGKDASGKIADVIPGRPTVLTRKVKVDPGQTVKIDVDLSAEEKSAKK